MAWTTYKNNKRALILTAAAIALFPCYAFSQVDPSQADETSQREDRDALALETVIITATKRPEAVRDIAGSVTAQTGEDLARLGADSMAEYLTRTPGVVFNASLPGSSTVVIRGTSAGDGLNQGTTGIFINEVPLTDPALSIGTPDIDTFDVDNVAILRGPQGTLFGSSSLGGAVSYQAAKPDLSKWQSHIQTTLESSHDGEIGGAGKIMVNTPLVKDKLAIRGVFVYRQDGGYIDNVGTGEDNSNRTVTQGGRILLTWKPTASTAFNYLYLEQQQDTDDAGYQESGLGSDLRKNTLVPEYANFNTRIHQLRMDHDFSFGSLTATATRHEKSINLLSDLTNALSADLFGLSPITSYIPGTSNGEGFEVRLASPPGGRFDYLIGAMSDKTKMDQSQIIYATGLADLLPLLGLDSALAPDDLLVDVGLPTTAKESALFGEGTYHINEQWKFTLGGRLFEQRLTNISESVGTYVLLTAGEYNQTVSGTRKFNGFNPKASITWTPNNDLMIYALASKGFRFGGSNLTVLPGVPSSYDSDSLWNYELGARADFWDRKLLLDITGFYIDWANIQLPRRISNVNFLDNAGAAEIFGIEASATMRPVNNLEIASNVTYLDASLSSEFDPDPTDPTDLVFPSGTRLPGASKWQVSNTISYTFAKRRFAPDLLLSHRYLSSTPADLEATSRQGGYNLFDARAGIDLDNGLGITVFVENISDERAVSYSVDGPPIQQYVVRPRTIGISLDAKF